MRSAIICILGTAVCLAAPKTALEDARDRQDRAALDKLFAAASARAGQKENDGKAQYDAAVAASYAAEVALEVRDKAQAQRVAEAGIKFAERATALQPGSAEAYQVLGTLCGQVIPANVLAGLTYGKRARDAVNKAIELAPKFGPAYLTRGVGNYYLPAGFGGGVDKAIADFRKALELDPGNADGWLWLGIALRKQGHNQEAREAFTKGLQVNPARVWMKQQLEKTPAK